MPLIKDKYRAKGANTRSKYITRKKNKAIVTDSITSTIQTTEQKQSLSSEKTRFETPGSTTYGTSQTDAIQSTILGTKLSTANSVNNIFNLNKGESLKDIIISHYLGDTSSVISLHWSLYPISNLTFTVSTGIITAATGGTVYRLFTDTFTSSSTLSLNSDNMFNSFVNVSKNVYFYAVCSVVGPEITIIKCY